MKKYVQRNKNESDQYETPQDLFQELDSEFHFDLDPCASDENHKCDAYYTIQDDGLTQNWGGVPGVLQSALLEHWRMGRKSFQGVQEGPYACCHADPGQS